ncbi:RNA methyltransferase, TrmH family, group 1 [Aciduliprofundum sp. MAR08-339]|uniref:RNA methyltransferase n=1 Tax=Aciduliprofundum sp. (strain MAR08-339) TaxID=673860 RepID=UPI0002A4BAF5|nr:RNA methyltransferase, TrmH family, group 1 [Aciduliprofundum sp. MAR08-339]
MDITVIFVEPQFTGNIGFLARTMANFNFKNLVLVNPPPLDDDAFRFAKHARYILENAEIVKDFEEVRRSFDYLVATSGVSTKSPKKFKRIAMSPREFAEKVGGYKGKMGMVFGRENYGLYNGEIEQCDALITIPTSEDYPIMNVTHAAAIVLYELFLQEERKEEMPIAENFELNLLNSRFSEILDAINFPAHKRKNTEVMFRRIIGRAMLTKWEYHSMMGVFKRILYKLER